MCGRLTIFTRLPAPAVRERVLREEEAGVIAGYRLELNPAALGYKVSAYVRVRPAPGQLPNLAELARMPPQVVECHRITGEDCDLIVSSATPPRSSMPIRPSRSVCSNLIRR